jgi:hypothetical protein
VPVKGSGGGSGYIGGGSEDSDDDDGWEVVGEWSSGRGGRGEHHFVLHPPTARFSKLVKFKFIDHHGSAYYCPITTIRVHGKTMMEEFVEEGSNNNIGIKASPTSIAALIARPTVMPLATVLEFEGRCVASGPPLITVDTTAAHDRHGDGRESGKSSENIFKDIHDRLCRVEQAGMHWEEVRGQLDGLARILVNLAGRRHLEPVANHTQSSSGVSRTELYSTILLSLTLFSIILYYALGAGRNRHSSSRQLASPSFTVPNADTAADLAMFALDNQNADFLGTSMTPDGHASPVSPTNRRQHHTKSTK